MARKGLNREARGLAVKALQSLHLLTLPDLREAAAELGIYPVPKNREEVEKQIKRVVGMGTFPSRLLMFSGWVDMQAFQPEPWVQRKVQEKLRK